MAGSTPAVSSSKPQVLGRFGLPATAHFSVLRLSHRQIRSGRAGAIQEIDPDEVPSSEEVKRLLVATEPEVFRTFFLTAALTGARSGEVLALTWSDIDFDAAVIRLRRAVTFARTKDEKAAA